MQGTRTGSRVINFRIGVRWVKWPSKRMDHTLERRLSWRVRFCQEMRCPLVARTSPEQAAQRIIRAIERNELRVLIGADAKLLDFFQRLRPATYWKLMARAMERISRK